MIHSQTPEKLGKTNKQIILELLRKEGPLSRADISRRITMSSPAVSSNIKYLLDNQYVSETGVGNNVMGRKSTLIEFNANRGHVIGIDFGRNKIRVMVADLLGEPIPGLTRDFDTKDIVTDSCKVLEARIRQILEESELDFNDISSAGIGIPGIIAKDKSEFIIAPYIKKWRYSNFYEQMGFLGCPIQIENTVNLGAIGEQWKGLGREYSNILYINYSVGIGAALILDNKLYRGANNAAGEIAYTAVSASRIRLEYDEVGGLEELISGEALDKEINESGLQEKTLAELFVGKSAATIEKKREIVDRIDTNFGLTLLNTVAVLNPDVIIVSGGIGLSIGAKLKQRWETMLARNAPYAPRILISQLGNTANLYGAIKIALDDLDQSLFEDNSCQ